jgi:alpha-beta hydrolase superfamily lysophospholipase
MTEMDGRMTPDKERPSTARRVLKGAGLVLLGLAALILVLGLIPISMDGLESQPMPVASYEEAVRRFATIAAEEAGSVNDASRSLLLTHGDAAEKVYVLIHGITASPRQWEDFGNILHERGYNVLIMRMPHHGLISNDVDELKVMRAEELGAYGDAVVDIARGLGEEITVIGLSGGGTVATWIGQNRADVSRVLGLSPFFGVPEVPPFLNTFLMNLTARLPNINLDNPALEQADWRYRGESTRSAGQFARLGKRVLGDAAREAPPLPLAHFVMTASDGTADNDYTVELATTWEQGGVDVSRFEFAASYAIPHASIEPGVDPEKKALVYAKLLETLGEAPLQEALGEAPVD